MAVFECMWVFFFAVGWFKLSIVFAVGWFKLSIVFDLTGGDLSVVLPSV